MNRTPPGRGPIHSISHSGAAEFSSIVDTRLAPPYSRPHMNHIAPRYAYYYGYIT